MNDWRYEFDMLTRQEQPRRWFVYSVEAETKKKTKRWYMNYIGEDRAYPSQDIISLKKTDKKLLTYYRNKITKENDTRTTQESIEHQ